MADDSAALRAACTPGAGLCTVVGIEGSFSRRLGAQLAVMADGSVTGSLADGCLEKQLATEVLSGEPARVLRFGAGSPLIDFRLPCGSGLDVLVDPAPDREACRAVLESLARREPATLALPAEKGLTERQYIPALRLLLFGEGPELEALALLGRTAGMEVESFAKDDPRLSLGKPPQEVAVDPWSAVILLFHDHEWEQAILRWALDTPSFFIGAQGGKQAREERTARLVDSGVTPDGLARISSPIGVVRHSREPMSLALSILASVSGAYEGIHPHR